MFFRPGEVLSFSKRPSKLKELARGGIAVMAKGLLHILERVLVCGGYSMFLYSILPRRRHKWYVVEWDRLCGQPFSLAPNAVQKSNDMLQGSKRERSEDTVYNLY